MLQQEDNDVFWQIFIIFDPYFHNIIAKVLMFQNTTESNITITGIVAHRSSIRRPTAIFYTTSRRPQL